MKKSAASIRKEFLLLIRDIEGLILMFFMPLALVFMITLMQERSYQTIHETRIPIVLIDNDMDSVGVAFAEGVMNNAIFDVTLIRGADSLTIAGARQDVASGKYQIGIVIPGETTKSIRNRVVSIVQQQIPGMRVGDIGNLHQSVQVDLFFDPITKLSFRNIIKSNLREFSAMVETRTVFLTYSQIFDAMMNQSSSLEYPEMQLIEFEESYMSDFGRDGIPNSVQHNVPAWTLFAIFFICVPLAGNFIKERDDGCLDRLRTMPVSYITIVSSKLVVFLLVALLQTAVVVAVGIWLMPLVDIPALEMGRSYGGFIIMTVAVGLAATAYGILIGTVAKTYVQASAFGAVSVVILSAIGGVYIPIYVMSPVMRQISELSPMNWGIQGYYEFFLRDAPLANVWPYALRLFGFFAVCLFISYFCKKFITK